MSRIGLKVYSTNVEWFEDIISLWRNAYIDYIEIYVVPSSYDENYHGNLRAWSEFYIEMA